MCTYVLGMCISPAHLIVWLVKNLRLNSSCPQNSEGTVPGVFIPSVDKKLVGTESHSLEAIQFFTSLKDSRPVSHYCKIL